MGWKKGRIMKLTKKQFSEFKRVNNLRKQMLRKKGKFINPEVWIYGFVTDLESDDDHGDGALIFIEWATLQELGIEVNEVTNES